MTPAASGARAEAHPFNEHPGTLFLDKRFLGSAA
jgi:hypothetical protein